MSVNKHKPHLFILPEDDANSQLAHGFVEQYHVQSDCVQIRTPAGGWKKVLEKFEADYADGMKKYPKRMMMFLIDSDNDSNRLERIREQEILKEFSGRVFVLGVQSEPEKLRTKTRMSFAEIGNTLAAGCPNSRNELWSDELLQHNEAELDRMIPLVKSFLFNAAE